MLITFSRYLWIDAICIIQNSIGHKKDQIERMAHIYMGSYLTIVALTATSGGSPLPGVSQPRPRLVEVVKGLSLTVNLQNLSQTARNLVYEKRCWTYQERLISKRNLYFTERQVFFECSTTCTSDHDQIYTPPDSDRSYPPFNPLKTMMNHLDGKPISKISEASLSLRYLEIFSQIVSQYTSRNLSFESDIENAFLGIQHLFLRNLKWNFVFGLPMEVFDWSLLWCPNGPLSRRRSTTRTGSSAFIVPPSWSWIGWVGQVSYTPYTGLGLPLLRGIRPRIETFDVSNGTTIRRKASQIWHEDASIKGQIVRRYNSPKSFPWSDNSGLSGISQKAVLAFRAEATGAFEYEPGTRCHKRNFKLGVEWLCTGGEPLARRNYNDSIMKEALKCDLDSLELVAMALCETPFSRDKGSENTLETGDKLIVMLVHWDNYRYAERIAIGCADERAWDQLLDKKEKAIRLC
jgi:hypothetical protein